MMNRYRLILTSLLMTLLIVGKAVAQVTVKGSVFGGGNEADVKINTTVQMDDGQVNGNIYGGGNLGDVGTIDKSDETDYNYTWTGNTDESIVSGLCTVTISGGTVGPEGENVTLDGDHGNVFGAGKGEANTFWCEKGMVYKAIVNISAGTVKRNVYGGGKIGRVETNTQVTIGIGEGSEGGTSAPTIGDNVFGAGAGVLTHGYSALVRGNSSVTVQGNAKVGNSVYGGGELATVGKYNIAKTPALAEQHHVKIGMPYETVSGGICTVEILGHAQIGPDASGHVFGAGMGVDPTNDTYSYDDTDEETMRSSRPRRMTLKPGILPTIYDATDNDRVIWEYFDDQASYYDFLQTLALVTNTNVTIRGNASVNGSVYGGSESGFVQHNTDVRIQGSCTIGTENVIGNVYGGGLGIEGNGAAGRVSENAKVAISGGEINGSVYGGGARGIVKGGVKVDLLDGVVKKDVYGGGALADTNTGWEEDEEGTTVNLLGGVIEGNAYGGGLGDADIPALVHGDVLVDLNGRTTTITSGSGIVYESTPISTDSKGCIVQQVFGCNNVNGSPQRNVVVHVHATQNPDPTKATINDKPTKNTKNYEMRAVYGGGNQAAYDPVGAHSDNSDVKAAAHTNVIIDGCGLTSIETVYGGGNAASTPATNVTVNGTYEINEVFGGGNGLDAVNGMPDPGANVGYMNYSEYYQEDEVWKVRDKDDAATKEDRLVSSYAYGSGVAALNIFGGLVHKVFGGSNTKGNVRQTAVTMLDDQGCDFCVDEAYGGGKSAPMDAEAKLLMACIPGLKAAYGGAEAADIQGNVTLNITNGSFDRVFGGNNKSGTINGSITLNIEETGCRPVIIGELYGGGNEAAYSIYGYKTVNKGTEESPEYVVLPRESAEDDGTGPATPYADPQVNIKSFTRIGTVYGGGLGVTATMVGNPHVNINQVYGKQYDSEGEGKKFNVRATTLGTIGNVFGGGNQADVKGDTYVNIGTESKIDFATADTYMNETEPRKNVSVEGANITGDVFGGGNNAKVWGNTHVNIGKD